MRTLPFVPVIADETIERAFAIAFDYIARTRQLTDEKAAQEFVASTLVELLQRGERHPLRLANLAIAAYERAHERPVVLEGIWEAV